MFYHSVVNPHAAFKNPITIQITFRQAKSTLRGICVGIDNPA